MSFQPRDNRSISDDTVQHRGSDAPTVVKSVDADLVNSGGETKAPLLDDNVFATIPADDALKHWLIAVDAEATSVYPLALEAATRAFLLYPQLPPSGEESTALASVTLQSLYARARAQIGTDFKKHNTGDTHRALVVLSGVLASEGKLGPAVEGVRGARESLQMWWDAGAVGAGVKEDEGWVRTRMARLFTFSGALLMQVGPFKEGWVDLEKAVEQDAECVRARELKCVVGFKALKFDAVLQDVAWFKERAAAPTKYFVGAFLAASMACFMKARVVEGHEYAALAFETSSRFGDYPGPDPKMFVMAKETQVIFANKKGGL